MIRAFQSDVDLVIFDQNLTPTQARNLARAARSARDRSHAADPRHLRAARHHPGRQAPGRARAAALPAAAPRAGRGPLALAAGRRDRRARARRDEARGGPPARARTHLAPRARARHAAPPARGAAAARARGASCRSSRSSATPTPARARCCARSRAARCWSTIGCSRPSIPPRAGCASRASAR